MIRYILREGFAGFKRAKLSSTISVITIVITLVLLGAFAKLAINAASVIEQVRSQFEVELFLTDEITSEDIYELEKKLQGNPFTKSTKFISKAEAAKIFEKEFGENIVQMIGINPLPPSIKIKAQSDHVQTDSVLKFLSQFEGDLRILDTKYNLKFLKGFQRNTRALAAIGFGLGILLMAASISLVSNTTRLAILAKQDMIKTMKLVGATLKGQSSLSITSELSTSAFPSGDVSIYTSDLIRLVPGSIPGISGAVPTEIVRYHIRNNSASDVQALLRIEMSKDGTLFGSGSTGTYIKILANSVVSLTNVDFLRSGQYYMKNFNIDMNVLKQIFSSNEGASQGYPEVLPNGSYQFKLVATESGTGLEIESSQFVTVFNKTGFVNLLAPGNDVGFGEMDREIEVVNSITPVFSWSGDAVEYEFMLWEDVKNLGRFADVQMSSPLVQKRMTSTSYQYSPLDRQLIPGRVYYWQVSGIINTAFRGQRKEASRPYVFRTMPLKTQTKLSDAQSELFMILTRDYDFDAKTLEGANVMEYTVFWKNHEKTFKSVDYLLELLKRK
ncbi:hypothetical protein CHS0354_024066 [Potamilus streckersoni]|uniref:FtsX extracellular domain-containing protein n=1 Tax=Potamilus streckersoni TaxID=2493646 RepID=A0AAE0RZB5_9BIVA|nr:hypothetical protein CHS0354_024066 [Potamilus streckersoni]